MARLNESYPKARRVANQLHHLKWFNAAQRLWHNAEIPRCPLSGRYQGHSVDVKRRPPIL
jgi:hypothetical protein